MTFEKAILERDAKSHQAKLQDSQSRLEETCRNLADLEIIQQRVSKENTDLERKLDASEGQVGQLQTMKIGLEKQLADAMRMAEDEAKERMQLAGRQRATEEDRQAMRQHLEEVLEEKDDLMRQLSRANGDVALWRSK